VRGKTTITSNL